jgi:hypothetical protein
MTNLTVEITSDLQGLCNGSAIICYIIDIHLIWTVFHYLHSFCSTVNYLIMHSVGSQLGLCIIGCVTFVAFWDFVMLSSFVLWLQHKNRVTVIYYIVIMLIEPSEAFVKLSRVDCLREAKLRCQKGLLNFCNCFCN